MATLTGKSIATTYDQLWFRSTTAPGATTNATQVKTTTNDGTADLSTPLYLGTERIGIGTTAPNSLLELASTNPFITVQRNNNATAPAGGIKWTTSDDTLKLNIATNTLVASDNGCEFNFGTSNKMFIHSGGNVGIGTTAPADLLHVSASAVSGRSDNANSQVIIERAGHAYLQISTNNSSYGGVIFGDDGDNSRGNIAYNHATDNLSLRAGGTDHFTLTSGGNVGIGVTDPDAPMEIYSNVTDDGDLLHLHHGSTRYNAGSSFIKMNYNEGATFEIYSDGADEFIFKNNNTDTHIDTLVGKALVLQPTLGKVGIGTVTPDYTLQVNGDIAPEADNTSDLGKSSLRWANIYTADLHLKNDVGDWTVEEGAEELFIRNNLTGKKYAIMMREIDEQS